MPRHKMSHLGGVGRKEHWQVLRENTWIIDELGARWNGSKYPHSPKKSASNAVFLDHEGVRFIFDHDGFRSRDLALDSMVDP